MNKLRIFTALSKAFGYVTWCLSNVMNLSKNISKRTINSLKLTQRYDIKIFNNDEEFENKTNASHKVLVDIINSMDVYPGMMIIVKRSNNFWNKMSCDDKVVGNEEEK
tara:strand:+ start:1884 stop:2207 length:324 start_codon:yes stop_codon:yes gene_type:complete